MLVFCDVDFATGRSENAQRKVIVMHRKNQNLEFGSPPPLGTQLLQQQFKPLEPFRLMSTIAVFGRILCIRCEFRLEFVCLARKPGGRFSDRWPGRSENGMILMITTLLF